MNRRLKPLTAEQIEYAKRIFPKNGLYKKNGEVWCQCCGRTDMQLPGIIEIDIETGYQCFCGNFLELSQTRKFGPMVEKINYSVVQTCKGWQVIRTFNVTRYNQIDSPTEYKFNEVYQNWISPEGREVILGKSYTRYPFYLAWNYNSEFRLRQHNASTTGSYAFEDMFDVTGNHFYPKFNITRKLRKYGWCKAIETLPYVSIVDCMKMLLNSNQAETVVKQRQYDVFLYMLRHNLEAGELQYVPSLNICHRNGYIITDASIYFDMLSMMEQMGKDVRNPKLICPDDLYKAHNSVLAAYTKYRKKHEEEIKRKRAATENSSYVKDKERFFGLLITDGKLRIEVLKSVLEFMEEGKAMHHCVYENEYYKRNDCLILSAKVNGKRMETVEVNLKTFKIIQSRAVCNKMSKYHDQIIDLVNRNMNQIRRRATA